MNLSSFTSTRPVSSRIRWQTRLILGLATIVSLGAYLLYSAITYRLGFPLDDSWIHQTYARNLALLGEWSFIPGQISGGSTAPFWSALLAVGFLLHLSPYIWTFLLGGVLLFVLASSAEICMRRLIPEYGPFLPWAGLLLIFEWHMVWASGSGMETLFHALLVFMVLSMLLRRDYRWLLLGTLCGISIWVRPDGITLLGPVVFVALLRQSKWEIKYRSLVSILLGFGVFFAPYLLFNLFLAGTAFPTTFYAKQAEYVSWQTIPILARIWEVILKMLTGSGIALLPGIIILISRAVRSRDWHLIAVILWISGYLGIYLFRLPAYQHGRYLMPAMPIFFFVGLVGYYLYYYVTVKTRSRVHWFFRTSWGIVIFLLSLSFWFLGMNTYRNDVRIIESEMVDSAKWIAQNIPGDALVAAHDIGALGYFGNHQIIDLAGLISPDVIPFLRDEATLRIYLDQQQTEYLVAFPNWYLYLTESLVPIYSTKAPYAPALGETNMTIYQWSDP